MARRLARIAALVLAAFLAAGAGTLLVESRPYRGWEGVGVTVTVDVKAAIRHVRAHGAAPGGDGRG